MKEFINTQCPNMKYKYINKQSVESVKDICGLINDYCELPCAVLVGNKSDKEREVNKTDLKVYK
jgi:hypothetical protein